MIEHDIEDVGGLFAGKKGKENAAAKNRVDETGGVTGQHPAIAREAGLAVGKICARVSLGHAPGSGHAAGEERLPGERLFEELFRRFLRLPVKRGVADDADARTIVRQRNVPKPPIGRANHSGKGGIPALLQFHPLIVGEDRDFLQVGIGFLEFEVVAQDRMSAARVDHITGRDFFGGRLILTAPSTPPDRRRTPRL